jgi:ATP-dependent RNA helicase HrpA
MQTFTDLDKAINRAMRADRFWLRRQLKSIRRTHKTGKPFDRALKHLTERLEKSERRRASRAAVKPTLDWDEELPVVGRRQEIAETIRDHQVVIVCGETGSGKSTQLPRIALNLGRGIDGVIGHTQPRRIAARSIAARLAEETELQLGREIGYRIRFNDASGPTSLVRLMTDGILLAETQSDRFLDEYDTIIIDEAHERSLNIDFLLGYLKRLLPKRQDLKLIITSATIDAERFATHFGTEDDPVPVIQVSGRTYPVELQYQPLDDKDRNNRPGGSESESRDVFDGITDAISALASRDYSDILVFLPTERDIREVAKILGGRQYPGDSAKRPTRIVPLFGRLSMADQSKVFQPYPHRRIVLATNVAESSLTVPGIRYVVDTGTARISRYSARSRMQRLPIEPVSQASANQRSGRCGRVGPGVCIRLYSQSDYESREEFTAPEIQRTNLAAVILRTMHLKLGNIQEFPFLDPPKPTTIREGYKTLHELGAIDDDEHVTATGQRMAPLPVDPRVSRMILAAIDEQALPEVLVIAAALESQDPRDRPVEKQQQADEAHSQFLNRDSDFLTLLNLWDAFHEKKKSLSGGQLRKWCRQTFISWLRMREWLDVHRQLKQLLSDSNDAAIRKAAGFHPIKDRRNDFAAIHRSLMTGLLANIGMRTPIGEYLGGGGNKLAVWPGSALFSKGPKWFVAAELVETSKRFARTIARIQPEWIEPLAEHLVSREFSEPHWDAKAGNVMAFEKVSLWGLPIVPRRKTSFARVDPIKSRELLIQHGLVEFGLLYGKTVDDGGSEWDDEQEMLKGRVSRISPGISSNKTGQGSHASKGWGRDFPFLRENRDTLDEIEKLQARTRRHDFLPTDEVLFDFYANSIPDECSDRDRLRQWYRSEVAQHPTLLQLTVSQFTQSHDDDSHATSFPESLQVGSMTLPLSYQLTPGEHADGVTLTIPAAGLGQLTESVLHWLVPGLLEQKVLALVRSLPKHLRRQLVPAPETAALVSGKLRFGHGDLLSATAQELGTICGERIDAGAFNVVGIPDHLRFHLNVIDDRGKPLAEGRDLQQVRTAVSVHTSLVATPATASPEEQQWQRSGFKTWEFADVPEFIHIERNGVRLKAFPAVCDNNDSVGLTLNQTLAEANNTHRRGLRRLILLSERKRLRQQIDHLPDVGKLRILAASIKGLDLTGQLSLLMADRAYLHEKSLPRTQAVYDRKVAAGRSRLGVVAQEFIQLLPGLFNQIQTTRRQLGKTKGPGRQPLIDDLQQQLQELVHANFLTDTPWAWLLQVSRYLTAMRMRLQRADSGGLKTELSLMEKFAPYESRYRQRLAEHRQQKVTDPMLQHYRWMLEEFRVSLFAQKLGTAIAVSGKKLDEHWQRVT